MEYGPVRKTKKKQMYQRRIRIAAPLISLIKNAGVLNPLAETMTLELKRSSFDDYREVYDKYERILVVSTDVWNTLRYLCARSIPDIRSYAEELERQTVVRLSAFDAFINLLFLCERGNRFYYNFLKKEIDAATVQTYDTLLKAIISRTDRP